MIQELNFYSKSIKLLGVIGICCCLYNGSYSQQSSIAYLEVSSSLNDSLQRDFVYVVDIYNFQGGDSLLFVFSGEPDSLVYAQANSISGWVSSSPYRIQDNHLYLTIPIGAIDVVERFSAAAYIKSGNQIVSRKNIDQAF